MIAGGTGLPAAGEGLSKGFCSLEGEGLPVTEDPGGVSWVLGSFDKSMNAESEMRSPRRAEGRFFTGMGVVAIVIAVAGFAPAAVDSEARRAPMTLAVGIHGVLFTAWLGLFVTQTILVPKGLMTLHRRLGLAGVALAIAMVFSGYTTSIEMARRGYDLSGDLIQVTSDPIELLVFQLGDLLSFSILVGTAVLFRNRGDIHKRLMLLATVGSLIPAALAHIIGHSTVLREIEAPIILIPLTALLFAGAVHDRISLGRIHPVSLWVAVAMLVWANLRAALIGPSDLWRQFATWLIG